MKFNEEKMLQFAQKLGRKLEAQDVIVLTGELGAGKTTLCGKSPSPAVSWNGRTALKSRRRWPRRKGKLF